MIGDHDLNIIKQHGFINREEVLQKQKQAQILLLLSWNDQSEKGITTGKVFEYLCAKRPIINIGGTGNDSATRLIEETNSGMTGQNVQEIKNIIKKLYSEYQENKFVKYQGIETEINKYNHLEMAKKFSDLIENL